MPKLSSVQAHMSFVSPIHPKNRHFLKQNSVVVQGTTTKLTGITVEQQFLWMKTYENYIVFLRNNNTGTFD